MINSSKSGSADRAWWIVVTATGVLLIVLIVAGPATGIDASGLRYNPFPEIARRLLGGLATTGKVALAATVCATAWGLVIGVGRVSRIALFNLPASVYVEVVRGIPLLVILFMIYYGLNQFLPMGQKLGPFTSAIVGLSACYGAFIGEAVRAGVQAIPHEELEAAGLEGSRWQVLRYVALPRGVRTVLPAMANEWISLLKDTSLISILAISELTRTGQEYATSKFLYFETYAVVALIYLALTLVLSRFVHWLEMTWN